MTSGAWPMTLMSHTLIIGKIKKAKDVTESGNQNLPECHLPGLPRPSGWGSRRSGRQGGRDGGSHCRPPEKAGPSLATIF